MATTLVLVDYDNQRPPRFGTLGRPGRPPNVKDHEGAFEALRRAIVNHLTLVTTGFVDVRLRFYGGWSHDIKGTRTEAGDMLSSVIFSNERTRIKNVRIVAELAESLFNVPHFPLYRTFRQLPWKGDRLVLVPKPAACVDTSPTCHRYDALRSWALSGRCPNRPACNVGSDDCVEQKAQKLIDSMMVADSIAAAAEGCPLVVVSMDDDLVPGLLAASHFGQPTSLLRFGRRNLPGDYDALLNQQGIQIYDYPSLV